MTFFLSLKLALNKIEHEKNVEKAIYFFCSRVNGYLGSFFTLDNWQQQKNRNRLL